MNRLQQLACRLWRDESGAASAIAVILLLTIVSLGTIVGLVILRNQIVQEFGDVAVGLRQLDQSYEVDNCCDDCCGPAGYDELTDSMLEVAPAAGEIDHRRSAWQDSAGAGPAGIDIPTPTGNPSPGESPQGIPGPTTGNVTPGEN